MSLSLSSSTAAVEKGAQLNELTQNAEQAFKTVYELSNLLGTNLDKESVALIIALCERGINPEALANLIKELQRDVQQKKQQQQYK